VRLSYGSYTKNNEGWTALLRASEKGHTETVAMLLEKGADVNATDNDGGTALYKARAQEREKKLREDNAR